MALICICRGTRSGGQALARSLAEELGWPLLGREVLKEAAGSLDVTAEALERKIFDRPKMWSRFSAMRRAYIAAVQAALAERVVEGNLIYHGLAGGLLLRGNPALLCVRIIAPMPCRVRAVMADSDMDAPTAERYIRDVDEARARWVRVMYGENIMDPVLYDLLINLEPATLDSACATAAAVVRQPEFEVTEEVRRRLREFRLSCRVRVALAADPELRALELNAGVEDGEVVITGEAPLHKTGSTADRILEITRAVPGVEQVRLKVEWFDPYP